MALGCAVAAITAVADVGVGTADDGALLHAARNKAVISTPPSMFRRIASLPYVMIFYGAGERYEPPERRFGVERARIQPVQQHLALVCTLSYGNDKYMRGVGG